MSWMDRVAQLRANNAQAPAPAAPKPQPMDNLGRPMQRSAEQFNQRGYPTSSRANLTANQLPTWAQRVAGAQRSNPAPGGMGGDNTARPHVMPRQPGQVGMFPQPGGGGNPALRNALPGWMQPQMPGTPTELRNAEQAQQFLPWLGRVAGGMTGLPGGSFAGRQAGQWLGNRNMQQLLDRRNFQSPAQQPNVGLEQMMSRIDPNYAVRQQSSQGYAPGTPRRSGPGAAFGYTGMRGGPAGSGRGSGWRTVYQAPDEELESPTTKATG